MSAHRVVIVGGGFAGLNAARALRRAPCQVTLLDRRNFHLFQPLLYQVATGGLSPGDIASPLREVLRGQRNATVLLAEARDLDPADRRLLLDDGAVEYDTLVLATGTDNHYFGHEEWRELAPGLKSVEDATEIRRRVLTAFEMAELEPDPDERRRWLSFAVLGGGPTGVELAGTIGELARDTLRRDFRRIDTRRATISLVEGGPRILSPFPESLSAKAARELERLGVTVRTGSMVTSVVPGSVVLRRNDGTSETLDARTVLWAAGVRASPLGKLLAERAGAALDRSGRVAVAPDLTVPGHPEILVIGDLASLTRDGKPLPGVAPVAMQQGRYVGRLVRDRLAGRSTAPFRYRDKGSLATVGRSFAVASLGRLAFAGLLAWLLWVFVHIAYLIGFENRVLVLTQWAWSYVTRNRGARLITGLPRRAAEPERRDDAARPDIEGGPSAAARPDGFRVARLAKDP